MKFNGRVHEHSDEEIPKIDAKDKKILSILAEDGRIPLTSIAKKVRLSRDSVDYRIKRMQEKGVILRFYPVLNLQLFKHSMFIVFFLLDELDKQKQRDFLSDLMENPNVRAIREYSDNWDLEVSFVARTLQDFDDVLTEIISKYPNLILEKDKIQVIKGYSSVKVPNLQHITPALDFAKIDFPQIQKAEYDKTDIKLIQLLTEDARQSTYALGEKLGVSPDTISYRIKKLQQNDIIRKFTVMVNFSKLQYQWYTFCMQMKVFDKTTEKRFAQYVKQNSHILWAVKGMGAWDVITYVVTDSPKVLHSTVKDIKKNFSSVVRTYSTLLAYKEHYINPFPDAIANRILNKQS